ncbi:S8/S53 family peptidase [Kribbella sp. NBC_00709]|uniref:S8 family peptidase n=1 Tax=Kribbella sp. NBC_00709 TaxID=2975972 RepID=UPI002E2A8AA7|nr:S8/S53 family peptidase [Kribbella sp. NBC_00709]
MSEQQRLAESVHLILDQAGSTAAAYPPDWETTGRVEYFYRRNTILTRTKDADRVEQELQAIIYRAERARSAESGETDQSSESGGSEQEAERHASNRLSVIAGVVQFEWSSDALGTPEVLELLDAEFGVGTATPNHGLSLCPNSGHPCPATEPAEIPSESKSPVPPVSDGICCGTHGWDGDGVIVGVVDGGLIQRAPQTWPWMAGVYGDSEDPFDPATGLIKAYAGHGTFVAGCVRCIAPRAEVCVKRAEEIAGLAYEDEIIQKMSDALDGGADVIVCEFDGITRLHLPMLTFSNFYDERLRHLNVVVVAPAGNDTSHLPTFPAAYSWVIGVGALTANGNQRAAFSNYGGWVDVYAPGVDLVNAFADGNYICIHEHEDDQHEHGHGHEHEHGHGEHEHPHQHEQRHFNGLVNWSGTSFSAPLVAGMIAARMSATGENAPRAAEAVLRFASSQAIPGVGPHLLPHQVCGTPHEPRRTGCDCGCH